MKCSKCGKDFKEIPLVKTKKGIEWICKSCLEKVIK